MIGVGIGPCFAAWRGFFPATAQSVQGGWTWFNDPRAISVAGVPVVGGVNSSGDIEVHTIDGGVSTVELAATFEADDHDNPAFLIRDSDSKVMVWYSKHNGTTLNQHVSTSANDASAFGSATNIYSSLGITSVSYANPVQLEGEANDPIYLFCRGDNGGDRVWHYTKSIDDGVTWATAVKLLDSVYGYVKCIKTSSTRMDFFVSDTHPQDDVPGATLSASNSVYHFYYDGTWRETDGTALTLPIDPNIDLTPVWDGSTASGRSWVWDIQMTGTTPVVAYTVYPTIKDGRYRYAKWNGSTWVDYEVGKTGGQLADGIGQPYYTSGIVIDPDDVNVVYFGQRQADDDFALVRAETSDGGSTWSMTTVAQSAAPGNQVYRPYAVQGQTVEPRLIYAENTGYGGGSLVAGDLKVIDSRARTNAAPTGISLSKNYCWDDGAAGTAVAYLTATGDDFVDQYIWSITSDPDSKFQIDGDTLELAATVTAGGSHSVTIRCTNSTGATYDEAFTITVRDGSIKVATVSVNLQEQEGETFDVKVAGMGTPKFARFTLSVALKDGVVRGVLNGSMGMTDGTTEGCIQFSALDAEPDAAVHRYCSTSYCFALSASNGTIEAGVDPFVAGSFNSWLTDGMRLNMDVQSSGATYTWVPYILTVELFGGADLSADVGVINLAADTATVTTTPGFQVNDLTILTTLGATFNEKDAGIANCGVGFASYDGTTIRQAAFQYRSDDADPTVTRGEVNDGAVMVSIPSRYAVLQNITSTAFDLLTSGATSGVDVLYGALNFGGSAESWVGVLDTPTTTGDHDFTGPSFTPVYAEHLATMVQTIDTNRENGEVAGFARIATDGSHSASTTWADEDNADPTDTQTAYHADEWRLYDHQGTSQFTGAFDSFITGGVRVNFTDADGTARKWITRFIG